MELNILIQNPTQQTIERTIKKIQKAKEIIEQTKRRFDFLINL